MGRDSGRPLSREEGEGGKTKYYILMEELKRDMISGRFQPGDRLNKLEEKIGGDQK